MCLTALALTLSAEDVKMVRIASVAESSVAHKQMPAYPADALDHHIQGLVKISVRIGANGRIQHAGLVSGHPLLAPAAMQALKQWTFQPREVAGHAERVISEITFSFTLDPAGNPIVQNVWPTL